jgi:hypothetical protein
MRHSNIVVVQSFGTRAEADIALSILESSGIEAMIQADTAGGMREHLRHMYGTTYRELSDYRPGSCGRRNPIPVGAAPQAQPSGRTPDASSCYGDDEQMTE